MSSNVNKFASVKTLKKWEVELVMGHVLISFIYLVASLKVIQLIKTESAHRQSRKNLCQQENNTEGGNTGQWYNSHLIKNVVSAGEVNKM